MYIELCMLFLCYANGETYNPVARIQLHVECKSGRNMMEHNPGEAEVLYERGASFRVKKIDVIGDITHILLEEYSMASLTFEQFRKLPGNLKGEAYAKLSDHDKFLVRISMPPVVRESSSPPEPLTDEEKRQAAETLHKILIARGVISADEVQIINGISTIVPKKK